MKTKFLLYIFLIILLPNLTYSQYSQWENIFRNGPYNEPTSIKADNSGNTYVTGAGSVSNTIKINSLGNLEWSSTFGGGSRSMTLDTSGNIFVTGYNNDYDYATVKYNNAGVQQWMKTYNNSSSNGEDEATSIANVRWGYDFVTGFSYDNASNFDYATIMYASSDGSQGWVARYNGPGNGEDRPVSVKVTSGGSVYVTGNSKGNGTGYDYATVKYNSSGVQQWVMRYNGSGNGDDFATGLVITAAGNVYVSGYSYENGTGYDIVTIKYDSSGVQKRVKKYNGTGNSDDGGIAIDADNSENIIVSGHSIGDGTIWDFATIKYNSAGVQQWVSRYSQPGTSNFVSSMTIDNSNNIYVAGYNNGYVTVKYNTAGTQQWVTYKPGDCPPIICNSYKSSSITVDSSANVYVTGKITAHFGTSPSQFYTIKYPYFINPGNGQKFLKLKSLIEGFYNEQSNIMIPDTINVSLRSSLSPYSFVENAKSVSNTNGIALFNFYNSYSGTDYYLQIKHRNSIETWSNISMSFINDSLNFDLSSSQSQSYGNNMKLKGSRWTVFSGDVNQDEIIDASDFSNVENDASIALSGYVKTDVTGDDFVDASDLSIVENNATLGIVVQKP